jgi:cyclopropane-fatty-acyl-phospholipid synthase
MHPNLSSTLTLGASAEAIEYHYDVSNDFYKLWLDESLTYSCALWDKDELLEGAQLAKLDFHIRNSKAQGKARVLDIGCGWGAMLNRLVTKADVSKAVGLTLSRRQADHIASVGQAGVEVRLENWGDHQPSELYDSVISVGAFEHFAQHGLTWQEKTDGYRKFFQKCFDMLQPGGHLSLQTMSYENASREDFSPFFASQIFPESDLPRLSEIAAASDRLFEVVTLRNDRAHYARTSLEWRRRLRANRQQAIALVGLETYNRYDLYLHLWAIGFHVGTMGLLRIQFKKIF